MYQFVGLVKEGTKMVASLTTPIQNQFPTPSHAQGLGHEVACRTDEQEEREETLAVHDCLLLAKVRGRLLMPNLLQNRCQRENTNGKCGA